MGQPSDAQGCMPKLVPVELPSHFFVSISQHHAFGPAIPFLSVLALVFSITTCQLSTILQHGHMHRERERELCVQGLDKAPGLCPTILQTMRC